MVTERSTGSGMRTSRTSAVKFNEGPSFDGKPGLTELEFEVVFTDPALKR
jgi:hypothetical protein